MLLMKQPNVIDGCSYVIRLSLIIGSTPTKFINNFGVVLGTVKIRTKISGLKCEQGEVVSSSSRLL